MADPILCRIRHLSSRRLLVAALLIHLVLGAIAALFSRNPAQFVGWLVPGAAMAWAEGDRGLAVVAGSAVLLTELFWIWYGAVIQSATPALLVVAIRNAVLAALALSAIVALGRASLVDADL